MVHIQKAVLVMISFKGIEMIGATLFTAVALSIDKGYFSLIYIGALVANVIATTAILVDRWNDFTNCTISFCSIIILCSCICLNILNQRPQEFTPVIMMAIGLCSIYLIDIFATIISHFVCPRKHYIRPPLNVDVKEKVTSPDASRYSSLLDFECTEDDQ